MKMMKKIMMLLLVLMFVCAMVACGEKDDDSSSKKGSSRKKDDTEQNVTPTDDPDPTAEPTEKPEPTAEPVITDTPTPTEKPNDPTPTEVPGPSLDGDLDYDFLAGKWTGVETMDFISFLKMVDGIDESTEEGKEYIDMFKFLLDGMEKAGNCPDIEIRVSIDFTSEEECTISYAIDALKFGEALKKFLMNEDNMIAFIANTYGVDASYVQTILTMSGMTMDQLMAQVEQEYSEAVEDMSQSEEDDDEYTINGNRIVMEDAGDCFYYDKNKNAIIMEPPADEPAFAFLNGFALKKER